MKTWMLRTLASINVYSSSVTHSKTPTEPCSSVCTSHVIEAACSSALSQSVQRATTARSHPARLTLHEKHRHVLTIVFAVSRAMDETPSFVVAVAVAKLGRSSAIRSWSSDSVSVPIRRANGRSCIDMNLILVVADEGIYLRDQVVYRNVIGDVEQPLKVIAL